MNAIVYKAEVPANHPLHVTLSDELPTGCTVKVTVEAIVQDEILDCYVPRTEIGRKMLAARRAYIESGGKLMTWDEVNDEIRRRQGGVSDE